MKVIIHIGLVKTGSSYLQSQIFSQLRQLNNVLYLGPTENINQFNHWSRQFSKLIISNENIAGHPVKIIDGYSLWGQFQNSINNILDTYKDPFIIIGFREPSSMIQSVYKQYLHEGGTQNWEQFHEQRKDTFPDQFYFSKYIRYLRDSFAPERVFLYAYSELKYEPLVFLDRINRFIGLKEKAGLILPEKQKKQNVSISYELEGVLINLNKLSKWMYRILGFRLALRIGPVRINPIIICRDFLGRMIKSEKKRDLRHLEIAYEKDWQWCLNEINKLKTL